MTKKMNKKAQQQDLFTQVEAVENLDNSDVEMVPSLAQPETVLDTVNPVELREVIHLQREMKKLLDGSLNSLVTALEECAKACGSLSNKQQELQASFEFQSSSWPSWFRQEIQAALKGGELPELPRLPVPRVAPAAAITCDPAPKPVHMSLDAAELDASVDVRQALADNLIEELIAVILAEDRQIEPRKHRTDDEIRVDRALITEFLRDFALESGGKLVPVYCNEIAETLKMRRKLVAFDLRSLAASASSPVVSKGFRQGYYFDPDHPTVKGTASKEGEKP